MTPLVLLLTLTLEMVLPPPWTWFAEDKFKHFFASFFATSVAASGARAVGFGRDASIWVGVSFGATAGILKEIDDRRSGSFISGGDLVFDAAGIGTGFLLLDAAQ